ncbi:DJ-1 family glyoxalase III [Rhabdochromatium marinum]|uniref:DJ-1 family glyoxalase III n=1 Tax=Rhabdochromatium marinum TaxID=48729 RepID=UPI001907FBF6|nr:DJ-1 family glyoxalase III [Rhabdochromatium marinum]MBK1647493.1 DJ-1 family protein [Rhabdochromatium marinum]
MTSPRVLVPLAPGCEELEAVTIIDLLRRADIEVVTAGLEEGPVRASRGVVLIPDTALDAVLEQTFDLIVLPGGLPGADHLQQDARLLGLLRRQAESGRRVGAICAAPKVLASAGLLDGHQATCYPGAVNPPDYPRVQFTAMPVVMDGQVATSRGPGTAMDFALELIAWLTDAETRDKVAAALVRPA